MVRTGADLDQLIELRRVLRSRSGFVEDEARGVGHAIDRFTSASSEYVPYLPPHEARGQVLADRLDELADRALRTHEALVAADRWAGWDLARAVVDAEGDRQTVVAGFVVARGESARGLHRWSQHRRGDGWKYTEVRAQNRTIPADDVRAIRDARNARIDARRERWGRWTSVADDLYDNSNWRGFTREFADDGRRAFGPGGTAAAALSDDAGRLARAWSAVSDSRLGAVGRLASKGAGVAGIALGIGDAWHGYHTDDTERMVTGGLGAVAGGAMLIPFPPVQAAAALVSVGLLVYDNREAIADMGKAAFDFVKGLF